MNTDSITQKIVGAQTAPKPEEADPLQDIKPEEMGSRLAILGKKEKGLRDQEQTLKQKLKEIEEREAKLSKYSKYEEINDENAVDFIKEKGLSLEKIQEKWLSGLGDDDLDPIQKRIRELEKQVSNKDSEIKKILDERFEQEETKKSKTEIDSKKEAVKNGLKSFIEENAEKYDLIKTMGVVDEVYKTIEEVYIKTAEAGNPRLLSFEEASQEYENHLAEQVKGLLASKKVRSLLGQGSPEDEIAQLLGQKTIDDSFTQSSSSSPELKTMAEREREAAKLFESMRG